MLIFFLQALEGEEDLQEVIERSREKANRRAASKILRDSDAQSSRNSPAVEETRGRKKKGRPPKNPVEIDFDLPINGKRKRAGKAASVTPSIVDDDDDSRDSVLILFYVLLMFLTKICSTRNVGRKRLSLPPPSVRG